MKFICILFIFIVIGESVQYFLIGPFDLVDISELIFGYFAFLCLMIGMFAWRRFYKLLNIYLFYTAFRIFLEFGFLGELTVATIIAINRKCDPIKGQFFESKSRFRKLIYFYISLNSIRSEILQMQLYTVYLMR